MSTFYSEPQSREILSKWLQDNGIQVHPALKIVDMDEGNGWMVEASARIPEGEICKLFTLLMMYTCTPTTYLKGRFAWQS